MHFSSEIGSVNSYATYHNSYYCTWINGSISHILLMNVYDTNQVFFFFFLSSSVGIKVIQKKCYFCVAF